VLEGKDAVVFSVNCDAARHVIKNKQPFFDDRIFKSRLFFQDRSNAFESPAATSLEMFLEPAV